MNRLTQRPVFGGTDSLVGGRQLLSRIGVRLFGAVVMALLLLSNQVWPVGWQRLTSLIFLSLTAGVMLRYHLIAVRNSTADRKTSERIIWFTSLLAVAGVQMAHLSLASDNFLKAGYLFMAPMVAQAMLVAALLGPSLGIIALTMTLLLLGMSRVLPPEILTATWLSGAVAAHAVNPLRQRSDLLRAMTVQSAGQALIATCMTAVVATSTMTVLEAAAWAAVAGIIATSIFWLGVAILERVFGIVSDWSLLELCSPEHPLIRDLCLRAPGTYAHSVTVGNLAESAARQIGANPLLCRTMAIYHDIGKAIRPQYFAENQHGENIHDHLSPSISAQMIAAHVKEGVELARQYHLPRTVVDAIAQHHGTSLIGYFFHKAKEETAGGEELEALFRYDGPKPQSKEVAILHLADRVEAASRTLRRDQSVTELVHRLIEESRADGQLDESDLTFRELGQIESSFVESLTSLRHDRVPYPSAESHATAPDLDSKRVPTPGT